MNELHIGFTGTQKGMTIEQCASFKKYIFKNKPFVFHHGDCIGADTQAHKIVNVIRQSIIIHPPSNPSKRSFCKGDMILLEKPYLERNKDIVKSSSIIIACPKSNEEELRSGTWATIRYTKKWNKQLIIIYPNGETKLFYAERFKNGFKL